MGEARDTITRDGELYFLETILQKKSDAKEYAKTSRIRWKRKTRTVQVNNGYAIYVQSSGTYRASRR